MKEGKLQIKRLDQQDVIVFQKLILLFREVFEAGNSAISGQDYLHKLLGKPGFIALAAIMGNEVAGGITAYELPMYYTESSELFIYDVAVRADVQGSGVGRKLLLALEEYCKRKGIKTMFVAANEEDEHAVKFYHATGGKAEKVVHFNFETG